MRTIYFKNVTATVLWLAIFAFLSCNRQFPSEDLKSSTDYQLGVVSKKVLYIMVDGAVGTQVKAANPATLNSLVDFSLYSWDALESYDYAATLTNENASSTQLTGVTAAKHQVTDAGFTANNLANYPSLFTRIKQAKPAARTTAYVSSQAVADNLAADATEKKVLADDAAVKAAAIAELKANNPQLVFANFSSVDKAGLASGYTVANAAYKNAITTVDGYIGEILAALRARASFKAEDWLIIITSNKGSNTGYNAGSKPWSAFDDARYNTFFFSFNPRFMSSSYNKPAIIPYIGGTQSYRGTGQEDTVYHAKATTAGTLFDFGANQDFTVQCKVKIPAGNYYYPSILGKRAAFDGATPGYVFFLEGDYWQINFGRASGGNRQIRGHAISDGNWHTLIAVVKQEGAARNVYTYTDGVLYNAAVRDIAGWGSVNTSYPFTLGTIPGNFSGNLTAYSITDVRIYNKALDGNYISNNYCRTDIDPTDVYKPNLIGFWPCTTIMQDEEGNYFPDLSGKNNPLRMRTLNPTSFNDVTTKVCPTIVTEVYKTVPNAVDVAPQIFDWLGIGTPAGWGLDGKYWIPKYTDLSN